MSAIAMKALQQEYKNMQKDPLEGVKCELQDENFFKWQVNLFGPPETIFAGGYFKALLEFPDTYPFQPPSMKFLEPLWHPNVYPTGELCISILHPPGEDAMSGERPEERWNPSQQVRTILLSVISLLNEPNISSPANVDASVQFRAWKEGKSQEYEETVKKQVATSAELAKKEGVEVPKTIEEYVIKHETFRQQSFDINYYQDDDDDDDLANFDDDDDDDEEDDDDFGDEDEDED
eukprot:m.214342 g.214342  ORF g.214342 m.214342 type:complete len:235 (-) comp26186_c0_seq3:44-748(-)